MSKRRLLSAFSAILVAGTGVAVSGAQTASSIPRNIIIFVEDGMREGSFNAQQAPTMLSIRNGGVFFANSHSLFPTFTTANASAIATGHGLGDTGDFSNTIYSGYPVYNTGNFGFLPGTVTPFVVNDQSGGRVKRGGGGPHRVGRQLYRRMMRFAVLGTQGDRVCSRRPDVTAQRS